MDADVPAYSDRTSAQDIMNNTPEIEGQLSSSLESPAGQNMRLVVEASHDIGPQELA